MTALEITGGLADVLIEGHSDGSNSCKLGDLRLFDVIQVGSRWIIKYKGHRNDPVYVDASDFMKELMSMFMKQAS